MVSGTVNQSFHLFLGHLWKEPCFSGSLGLSAPTKSSGTLRSWKTIKPFVPLPWLLKYFVFYYKYLTHVTRQLFIQILPLTILVIPSTTVTPGGVYCHHSAPRLPFWIVRSTTASHSYYGTFSFRINTASSSWQANFEGEQRSSEVTQAVQNYTS